MSNSCSTGFTAIALVLLQPCVHAATVTPTVRNLVEDSRYIVVGRVLSTELISASFGSQVRECGTSATIEVLDNVSGSAPRQLTVAFKYAPETGKRYFLPLTEGQGDFASDVVMARRPTEEYRALENCWAKIPELRAETAGIGEIRQVTVTEQGETLQSEWLEKPPYLSVPATVASHEIPTGERWNYASTLARDRLMPTVFRGPLVFVSWPAFRELFAKAAAAKSG